MLDNQYCGSLSIVSTVVVYYTHYGYVFRGGDEIWPNSQTTFGKLTADRYPKTME